MKMVFVVGAYNSKNGLNLEEYCSVELFCKSEKEAIKRAKELIKKRFYEVSKIIEVEKK